MRIGSNRWRCHVEEGDRMRAAAALHAQEPGKADDEEDERTGRHGRGEVQIAIQLRSS